MRLFVFLLLLALAIPPVTGAAGAGPAAEDLRALLVGCDRFVSQPDTSPAAENNVRILSEAIERDARGYLSVRTAVNEAPGEDAFRSLVGEAFGGADENDVSLVYIGTHGLVNADDPSASFRLLMSDGSAEFELDARTLYRCMDAVPGEKILIADACNSGALIGKGMSHVSHQPSGIGSGYAVLTSAGGSEPSFLWSSGDENLRGGGYFAETLAAGIGPNGNFAADGNDDGAITFGELHAYLLGSYALSTTQLYPADGQAVFFRYDPAEDRSGLKAVTDLLFEETVLTNENRSASFSYTLNSSARVAYQLVYDSNGAWDFSNPQAIAEEGSADGVCMPGRKRRTLELREVGEENSGYVLFFITVVGDDGAEPQAGALLCVQPSEGDPGLEVYAGKGFDPGRGEEVSIRVLHGFPCSLSLDILDAGGHAVATLFSEQPTRPQRLLGGGSVFYWNGETGPGQAAPDGTYSARVRATVGRREYSAVSGPISLWKASPLDPLACRQPFVERVFAFLDQADVIRPLHEPFGGIPASDDGVSPLQRLVDERESRVFRNQGEVHRDSQLVKHGQGRPDAADPVRDDSRFSGLAPSGLLELPGAHLKGEAVHQGAFVNGGAAELFEGPEFARSSAFHELRDQDLSAVAKHAQRKPHGSRGLALAVAGIQVKPVDKFHSVLPMVLRSP